MVNSSAVECSCPRSNLRQRLASLQDPETVAEFVADAEVHPSRWQLDRVHWLGAGVYPGYVSIPSLQTMAEEAGENPLSADV